MKVWHITDEIGRRIESQGVDFGSDVMIRYLDTDDVAVVPKAELLVRP
jgi:hypothetical protein